MPGDFAGRHVNDDFEAYAAMWADIKPARRYQIGYVEAVEGALHDEEALDTSIGMLQNLYAQKQYTKFRFATIAPAFYTFFYTFLMNNEVWKSLNDSQRSGVLRAAEAMQVSAVENEAATAVYHTALNRSLGVTIHKQMPDERTAWQSEFSPRVRDWILENSEDRERLENYLEAIQGCRTDRAITT